MSLISEKVSTVAQASILESGQLTADEIVQSQAHVHVATATYDFAVQTGAQATYQLALSETIPAGAYYVGLLVERVAAFTSGGASTVNLQLNAQNILNPASPAFNAVPYNLAAQYNATTALKMGAAVSSLALIIGGANLTAGKYVFGVQYIV